MRINHDFWQNSFALNQLVIIGALLDWATLVVDPRGIVVPEHVVRSLQVTNSPQHQHGVRQSPIQKQRWEQLVGRFYERLMDLSKQPEKAFSSESITLVKNYLAGLPSYHELVKEKLYPENRWIHIENPHHVQENKRSQWLTEYMLHLDEENALRFLESVTIDWVLQLSSDQLKAFLSELSGRSGNKLEYTWTELQARGYALYCMAEGLEH